MPTPTLGVCYYPEHWPQSLWEDDARRMAEVGISYVRIGEFAWSKLEPRPGELDFDWLVQADDESGYVIGAADIPAAGVSVARLARAG